MIRKIYILILFYFFYFIIVIEIIIFMFIRYLIFFNSKWDKKRNKKNIYLGLLLDI